MENKNFDYIVKKLHEKGFNDDQAIIFVRDSFDDGNFTVNDYEETLCFLGYALFNYMIGGKMF